MSKKIIKSWDELGKLKPSKTHELEIEKNGEDEYLDLFWIVPKNKNLLEPEHYISSHVFAYQKATEEANEVLKKCGFDVELRCE